MVKIVRFAYVVLDLLVELHPFLLDCTGASLLFHLLEIVFLLSALRLGFLADADAGFVDFAFGVLFASVFLLMLIASSLRRLLRKTLIQLPLILLPRSYIRRFLPLSRPPLHLLTPNYKRPRLRMKLIIIRLNPLLPMSHPILNRIQLHLLLRTRHRLEILRHILRVIRLLLLRLHPYLPIHLMHPRLLLHLPLNLLLKLRHILRRHRRRHLHLPLLLQLLHLLLHQLIMYPQLPLQLTPREHYPFLIPLHLLHTLKPPLHLLPLHRLILLLHLLIQRLMPLLLILTLAQHSLYHIPLLLLLLMLLSKSRQPLLPLSHPLQLNLLLVPKFLLLIQPLVRLHLPDPVPAVLLPKFLLFHHRPDLSLLLVKVFVRKIFLCSALVRDEHGAFLLF